MRRLLLSTVRPVAVGLAVLTVVPPAFARTVTCESRDYRYAYCAVQTYGDVTLRYEKSRSACHYGRSWGYDHRGVWVDRGCRATFAVDEGNRGRYSGYDYDGRGNGRYENNRYGHDDGSKAAAVAGVAVLGAAVAAAIIANKSKSPRPDDRDAVPSWLVGRFEGYNTQYRTDVAVQVSPSGSITAFLPEGQKAYGRYRDGAVVFADQEFDVERTSSGFTLTQRSDRTNVVVYHSDR